MHEPVTKERAQADWEERVSGPEESGGMSLLVVLVLIDIREELSMLREKVSGIEMNGRPG